MRTYNGVFIPLIFLVMGLGLAACQSAAFATTSTGVKMVLVPAGSFEMGSDRGDGNEQPVHSVILDDFYIDQYEVTNAQYAACVVANECSPPKVTASETRDSYYGNSEYDDYPVIWVDWNQAKSYCQWRGARLPTEAEWEKAARGTTGQTYPWGADFDGQRLNVCDRNCPYEWEASSYDDGYADTAPVGSYSDGLSPYGAYDMAGNVWEWVNDWYGEDYYAFSPQENPTGPQGSISKVLRGGSWSTALEISARAANRKHYHPDAATHHLGFRCVADTPG